MIHRDKPEYCYTSGCPLAKCKCGHGIAEHDETSGKCSQLECDCSRFEVKGKGFVPGTGDPSKTPYAMILEAPGSDEIAFRLSPIEGRAFFSTQQQCDVELASRRKAYPEIPVELLKRGAPIVGRSGSQLTQWVLPAVGLKRDDFFIDNTLRCLPPKGKSGPYPTGDDRKEAEKACRHYDRFDEFKPNATVISLHPAGILREVTPLPLQIKDFEKARDFVKTGLRTMVLLGGKAAEAFARCCKNVTKFRGAYFLLKPDWVKKYGEKFDFVAKKKRVKGTKKAEKEAVARVESMEDLFETSAGFKKLKKPVFKRAPRKKERTTDGKAIATE